jgi:hypothetical protein
MKKYSVSIPWHCTMTVEVEAIDKEAAINKAHRGMRNSLCWACSTHVTLDSPNEDVDSEVEEL